MDPRVLFAHERTLLAWIRTGLALTGFGFIVARFGLYLRELEAMHRVIQRPSMSLWLGLLMVAIGILVQVGAVFQHATVIKRLRAGETEFEPTFSPGTLLALALAGIGILIAAYLFQLNR